MKLNVRNAGLEDLSNIPRQPGDPDDNSPEKHCRPQDLAHAGRSPEVPLAVDLPGGGRLVFSRFARILPGRRYVGVGVWQGRRVFAKLLVGPRAERDFQREAAGVRLLSARGLATPRLIDKAHVAGVGGWLFLEYLENATSLGERWNRLETQAARARLLKDALGLIGRLHARGLLQEDLHPDNLLEQDGTLYLVDGGGIRAKTPGTPLGLAAARENLGLFCAQFPPQWDALLLELLPAYVAENPCGIDRDLPGFSRTIARQRARRLDRFIRKTGRDCSLFSVERHGVRGASGFCAMRRDEAEWLAPLLADPEAWIARGTLCKAGGSATVVRVEIGPADGDFPPGHSIPPAMILKRYNIKHAWHRLSRAWRESRAATAWREGNRLMALAIPTARPLAFLERRTLGLRGTAYLVTEYLHGESLSTRLPAAGADGPPFPQAELVALVELIAILARMRISHGDLKGSNLIWQAEERRWALIDLDAMRQHTHESCFRRAHIRDRTRLLANWPKENPLRQWLETHLPKYPEKPRTYGPRC